MEHNLGLTAIRLPDRYKSRALNVMPLMRESSKRRADGDAPHLGTACLLDKVIETMYETGKDMNDKYPKHHAEDWPLKWSAADIAVSFILGCTNVHLFFVICRK